MSRLSGLFLGLLFTTSLLIGITSAERFASAQSVVPGSNQAVKQVPSSAVAAALAGVQNHRDVRVHMFPTQSAKIRLPATVRNRNNFQNFDLRRVNLLAIPPEGVPGIPATIMRGQRPTGASNFYCTSLPCPNGTPWNPDNMVNSSCGTGIPSYLPSSQCTTGTILSSQIHPVYFNCPSHSDACWGSAAGDITTFITNMNVNGPLSVINQYVGACPPGTPGCTTLGRYPLSTQWAVDNAGLPQTVPGFTNKVITDADARSLVEAVVATSLQFGTGHMYHLFIPNGTDVCFDTSYSVCYSPDNSAFAFCGYHSSFTDGSGRHIYYSVEPYTFVSTAHGSCYVPPMSATDSQVSVLMHEQAEWITDPDPNNQWNSFDANLGEIGDMCAWNIFAIHPNGATYNTQLLYSNLHWACKAGP